MKIVSIHQPAYLPWLGFFHKLLVSDIFVILETTQFEKNSFVNRNKIRTANGWTWLTVPLLTKGHFEKTIRDMTWNPAVSWPRKHLESIKLAYSKAPFFSHYYPILVDWLAQAKGFHPLLMTMLRFFAAELEATTQLIGSSELKASARKSDLILEICRELGADLYFSGPQGADYLDLEAFHRFGIDVHLQDYRHPIYLQTYSGFESHMGIIDCLMNHGPEGTRAIIFEGNQSKSDLISIVPHRPVAGKVEIS